MKNSNSNSGLIPVQGKNFSGRSYFLKSLCDNPQNGNSELYLGEIPANFISGLVPTVTNEIELHAGTSTQKTLQAVNELLDYYDFDKHNLKNPFLLSGGEKTILVLLTHLLLEPDILTIDTLIEQLNKAWREPLLTAIQQNNFSKTLVYLADNRLEEYDLRGIPIDNISNVKESKYKYVFNNPIFIDSMKFSSEPKTIEMRDISFGYTKNETVLRNINLRLEPGEIYHLQGENGAGKTTLAKVLAGLLKLTFGQILVNNEAYNSYRYPGRLTGYSFQSPDEQLFSPTVEFEILPLRKNEPGLYEERREVFLKMFGLQDVRTCNPAELPYVMRKRISLAATLAMERPWYILDEPTLGQDDNFLEFLKKMLDTLTHLQKGILIISHSKKFVNELHCKKMILHNGKISF